MFVVVMVVVGLDSLGHPAPDHPTPDPLRRTAHNFPLPLPFRSFCLSVRVFSWNCERGRIPFKLRVWASLGSFCEPRRLWGSPAFHTTTRELQTCTFHAPGASNTTKIPREDPQRDTKRAKWWQEREKKSAKFWASHPSGPHPSGPFFWFGPPTLRGPELLCFFFRLVLFFMAKRLKNQFWQK